MKNLSMQKPSPKKDEHAHDSHDGLDEQEQKVMDQTIITKFPIGSCAHKQKFKEKLFSHAE